MTRRYPAKSNTWCWSTFARSGGELSEVREGVHNLQVRMTSLGENAAAMNRRLDSMDRRLERIEEHFELVYPRPV